MICFQLSTKVLLELYEKNIIETYWSEILFDDFVEGNSVMQLDFSSDARLKNYSIFKPQINLHALTSSFFFLFCETQLGGSYFAKKG